MSFILPNFILINETIEKYKYDPRTFKGYKDYKKKVICKCLFCNNIYEKGFYSAYRPFNENKIVRCIKCENSLKGKNSAEKISSILKEKYKSGELVPFMKGRKHTKEAINKIIQKNKGRTWNKIYSEEEIAERKLKHSLARRGGKNGFFGKQHTEEVKKATSLRNIKNLKDNKFGKKILQDKDGETYRSTLEVIFANFLKEKNISFIYEMPLKLFDNRYKIIDFVIKDLLIEITGIAYKTWEEKFIKSIEKLKKSTDKKILIFTYEDKIEKLKFLIDEQIEVFSIKNFEIILDKIE